MPECMICHRELGWRADWSMHMLPPYTVEQVQEQLREKHFQVIEFEVKPESVLTRGRKKGLAARDGGPVSTLF